MPPLCKEDHIVAARINEDSHSTVVRSRMNTKLNHVQNWPELAEKANWSVSAIAKSCGVSLRTLERHFRKQLKISPKRWLAEERQRRALVLLNGGWSVKETATQLGYPYAHHLSREFKKRWNRCPTD